MLGTVAVDGFADVVAGAMDKIFAEAGFFDVVAGSFVDFPSLQRLAGGDAKCGSGRRLCLWASRTTAKTLAIFSGTLAPR